MRHEDSKNSALWGKSDRRVSRALAAVGATVTCAALAGSTNVVGFLFGLGWIANWVELW